MPNSTNSNILQIALGLKIIISHCKLDDYLREQFHKLATMMCANPNQRQIITLPDNKQVRFDAFELWEYLFSTLPKCDKDALRSAVLKCKKPLSDLQLYDNQRHFWNISYDIIELFNGHIFGSDPYLPLKKLLVVDLSLELLEKCRVDMKCFLLEDNQEKALYLIQKIAGVISSSTDRQTLYLKPLDNDKNFIDLLLIQISAHRENSLLCAHMLYWIINYDDQFNLYHLELLNLLRTLGQYPKTERYVYKSIKKLFQRTTQANQFIIISETITNIKKYETTACVEKLLAPLKGKQTHTKEYSNDIIDHVNDGSLLKCLSDRYTDIITSDTFKPDDPLMYRSSGCEQLYSKKLLLDPYKNPNDAIDPIERTKLKLNNYRYVNENVLKPLLESFADLEKQSKNATDAKNANCRIADFILSIPTERYVKQKVPNNQIQDIRELGIYYIPLVSIRKIFMIFAENDIQEAQRLLINSLSGTAIENLDFYVYRLIKKAMFDHTLIPIFKGSIDKIKNLDRFFTEIYTVSNQKFNLITACMYGIMIARKNIDAIKSCNSLLCTMLAAAKANEEYLLQLFAFRDEEENSVFHTLISTVYKLTSAQNNTTVRPIDSLLQQIIDNLLQQIEELSKLAQDKGLLFEKNINNESILCQDLKEHYQNHYRLHAILELQTRINKFVEPITKNDYQQLQIKKPKQYLEPNVPYTRTYHDLCCFVNYFVTPIDQIKIHLKYSEENENSRFRDILCTIQKSAKLPDIFPSNSCELINCFIEFRFFENIDLITNSIEIIYDIFSQSNDYEFYLNNICKQINFAANSGHIEIKQPYSLSRTFFNRLYNTCLVTNSSAIFHTNIDIARNLIAICPLLLSYLETLLERQTQKAPDTPTIIARKKIIKILLAQKLQSQKQAEKPVLEQQIANENYNCEAIEAYFVENAIPINNNIISSVPIAIFLRIKELTDANQRRLLELFKELSKICPNFIFAICSSSKKNQPNASLFGIEELNKKFESELILIKLNAIKDTSKSLAKKRQHQHHIAELRTEIQKFNPWFEIKQKHDIQINDPTLQSVIDIYVNLAGNPDQQFTDIQEDCIKIIQNLLQHSNIDTNEFYNSLVEECYVRTGQYLYDIDHEKREAIEFLSECTWNLTIDWHRFIQSCRMLLKEDLSPQYTKYINQLLDNFSEVKNSIETYDGLIASLQANNMTIDFTSMKHVYPTAFKKVFGNAKKTVGEYIVMYKYSHHTILNITEQTKDHVILNYHPFDTLPINSWNCAMLLAKSAKIEAFSNYSQTAILNTLLASMCNMRREKSISKQEKIGRYLSILDTTQAMLNRNSAITLLENKYEVTKLRDPDVIMKFCRHILYSASCSLLLDEDTLKKTIYLVETIFHKIVQGQFKDFLDGLFYIQNKWGQSFSSILKKHVNEYIKKYMINMLYRAAKFHGCQETFDENMKKEGLEVYTKSLEENFELKNDQNLLECMQYCQNLAYIKGSNLVQLNSENPKPHFYHMNNSCSERQKIIWLLCDLIRKLHDGFHNAEKQKLCKNIWDKMHFQSMLEQHSIISRENQIQISTHTIDASLRQIRILLKDARKNPKICRLSKYDDAVTLINRILKCIVKFFIEKFYNNNIYTIEEITGNEYFKYRPN